jgi:hypothetical protein
MQQHERSKNNLHHCNQRYLLFASLDAKTPLKINISITLDLFVTLGDKNCHVNAKQQQMFVEDNVQQKHVVFPTILLEPLCDQTFYCSHFHFCLLINFLSKSSSLLRHAKRKLISSWININGNMDCRQ